MGPRGGLEGWFWNVGSTRHAQAVMCFRLCLCSSQRGGSTQICFFSFFVGKQRNPNPTSTIFVLLEQKPPKSFWLEKKQVLENKLTKDPNFDDGETEELSDFIHLTFGAPKCWISAIFQAFVTTGDGNPCISILNGQFPASPKLPPTKNLWFNMELIFQIGRKIEGFSKSEMSRYSLWEMPKKKACGTIR